MKTLEQFTSVISTVEYFIQCENESIALYEHSLHDLGDTIVSPVIHQMIDEKERQRRRLELILEEVKEQFTLDEAII